MKLTLGFSPCPNDTFIFDALVNHKIDTEGLDFEFIMADVEELNQMAVSRSLQITKLSYHAFLFLVDSYCLLDSGSALGYSTGPLIIARKQMELSDLVDLPVAIPGKLTSANMLFSLAVPGARQTIPMLFSDIEQAVLDGTVAAGVIIHENRFTFREKGLLQIADLGEFWFKRTNTPVPLGGIVADKSLDPDIVRKFNRLLRISIQHAKDNEVISPFVQCHAQEMQEEVIKKHIDLYVNNFSIQLGQTGRNAIRKLFSEALNSGLITNIPQKIFFDE